MSDAIAKAYEPETVEKHWYDAWVAAGCFKGELPNTEGTTTDNPDSLNPVPAPHAIVIPPPNVTGVLHMGHILNNTIQDILTRRARQEGKAAVWVPGTDHAGIATQTRVEKKLREEGLTKWDLGREAFVERAKQWRDEHGGIILKQLRKLGCSCDWDRTVHTLDTATEKSHVEPNADNAGVDYHRAVLSAFVELFHKGLIYRGKRMVNWCPKSLTALSDEEVIMKPQKGFLYKMRYAVVEADGSKTGEFVAISTTRPETLMGDTAVAIHPEDERYKHLHDKFVLRPFPEAKIPFVLDTHVDIEFGTGVLKVTPAHDHADFEIGLRHNLPVIDVLTPDGKINCPECQELHGKDRFEARKLASDLLDQMGLLVEKERYENNVGFSERADVPIEPRLSDQWWLKYPKVQEAKEAVCPSDGTEPKIKFYPERWTKTYAHWLDNIQDWCISRQLWWGHRIPVWYRKGIDRSTLTKDDLEDETKVWVSIFPPNDPENWEQEDDVLDTWASSWLWPIAVFQSDMVGMMRARTVGEDVPQEDIRHIKSKLFAGKVENMKPDSDHPGMAKDLTDSGFLEYQYVELEETEVAEPSCSKHSELQFWYPTEVLATGPDIIFFWVARMIMAGLEFMGDVPFKHVVFNGIIRDAQGRKMSKSLGNSPDPLDLIDKFGADGLRLGMLMIAPKGADILFSEDRVQQGRNFCNKLWNACRYKQMAEQSSVSSNAPSVPVSQAVSANGAKGITLIDADDHAIVARLLTTLETVESAYQHFEFNKLTDAIYRFFWTDYCDWYVEVSKAKLQSATQRESCLALLDLCLKSVLQILHPITPFITEELWHRMGYTNQEASAKTATSPFIHESELMTAARLKALLREANITLDAHAVDEVAALQSFVVKARALKAQYSLAAKNDVTFYLIGDDTQVRLAESHGEKLRKLIGYGRLERSDATQNMPSEITPLGTLYLDLAGSVDVDAEKQKLQKQLAGLEKAIKGSEAKLGNAKFTDKAPAEVVAAVRETLETNQSKRTELLKLIEGLG